MKNTVANILIALFLIFVTGESLNLYFKATARANRLESNLIAANDEAQRFKTRDGHNAAKITAQELTISELRRINPAIITQLKNLYIPPRLAQSYTQTSQTMQAEISAPVVRPQHVAALLSTSDTATRNPEPATFSYSDKWISITGTLDPDTAKINILATDTIFTAIYKGERRRPALWIFSRRKLQTAATNRSPYISINVVSSGVIKK
jgi:hypothetical protein